MNSTNKDNKKKRKRIITVVVVAAIAGVVAYLCINSESMARLAKSISSDLGGGIDRTVTVYDYNGTEIKSWSGKFDVSESENEVYFDDKDGKRVIIHGGIVINEEN